MTTNGADVHVANITGNIIGSVESYSYPTLAMIISGLDSGTTYNYYVIHYDITEVRDPVCGSFTTWKIISETNDDGNTNLYGMIVRMFTYSAKKPHGLCANLDTFLQFLNCKAFTLTL